MTAAKLLKILAGALLVFLAISMAQEWDVFRPWILRETPEIPSLSDDDLRAIEDTLRSFLSISAHFYSSSGDPRFAERLPASERLSIELAADVDYLRQNGRRQLGDLVRLDILGIERVSDDVANVHSREYWVIRTTRLSDGQQTDPARSVVLLCRYTVSRQGGSWIVEAWDVEEPAPTEEPNDPETIR